MIPAQRDSRHTEGIRSLEVRWVLPGQLAAAVAGWFGRFPAGTKVIEDAYLLDPHLPGLSVKVRGRRALEVKAYRGSPGLLEVLGRAHGRLESWQKWSFPHGPPSHDSCDPAGWRLVSKKRRISWFSLAGGPSRAAARASQSGAVKMIWAFLPGLVMLGFCAICLYSQIHPAPPPPYNQAPFAAIGWLVVAALAATWWKVRAVRSARTLTDAG